MIEPGGTIGMLGSGQLGRMFVHAAQQMGYRVHVFSPDADSPAGQAANKEIAAAYDDFDALREFAESVDVVTLEFENIPTDTVDAVSEIVSVHPGRNVLSVAQNRIREKSTIRSFGLPVPDFAVVESANDIVAFLANHEQHGGVLKSAESGYDGKGQARVETADSAEAALSSIGHAAAIIEEFVPYQFETSVISARSPRGEVRSYAPIVNMHHNHILDVSVAPSSLISASLAAELIEIAENLMSALEVIGVLCVEFFYAEDGRILINEIAPRPHNSGHLTIEACVTSQFQQQVRSVCDLPLGSTEIVRPAAMVNLLGQHLAPSKPNFESLFTRPQTNLHLYGKSEPRDGRKMGHITVTADSAETAESEVRATREELGK
ncbi:MAG: 5-(carboxyamino)imidazole ribonucleotide synthase [Planctomycetaceae bacterium]